MAISVGEIEATLKLKDELSKQLNAAVSNIQQASAKVATLGSQFGSLGGSMTGVAGSAQGAGSAIAGVANKAQGAGTALATPILPILPIMC
jgi:hypothetical protein